MPNLTLTQQIVEGVRQIWDHILNRRHADIEIDFPPRITNASILADDPLDIGRLTEQPSRWTYQYLAGGPVWSGPIRNYESIYGFPIEIIYLDGQKTYYHDEVFWTRTAIEQHLKKRHGQPEKPNFSLGDI